MLNNLLFQSKKLLVATLLSLLSLFLILNLANAAVQEPRLAWEKIAAGAMVLDVRTPEEFAEGHLTNAVNIPFEQVAEEFAKRGITKNTPVVLYCRSGRRSSIAAEALTTAGYIQIYNGGGYQTLLEAQKSTK